MISDEQPSVVSWIWIFDNPPCRKFLYSAETPNAHSRVPGGTPSDNKRGSKTGGISEGIASEDSEPERDAVYGIMGLISLRALSQLEEIEPVGNQT